MKRVLLLISLIFLVLVDEGTSANPEKDFKVGNAFASELLNQGNTVKIEELLGVPDPNPPEASYGDAELEHKAQGLVKEGTASGMIVESSRSRERYKIDPETDPVIQSSNEIVASPLTVIGGKGTKIVKIKSSREAKTVTCEESGDSSQEACKGYLNIKLVEHKKEVAREGALKLRFFKGKPSCKDLVQKLQPYMNRHQNGLWSKGSDHSIQTLDVTEAYKACLNEGVNPKNSQYWNNSNYDVIDLTSVNPAKIKKVIFHSGSGWWARSSSSKPIGDFNWSTKSHYSFIAQGKVTITEEVTEKIPDEGEWLWACDDLEGRSDRGLCTYETEDCTSGQQTRIISGLKVTRPCWEKTRTYLCSYPARNDCGPLRAQGCYQTKSTCQKWVGKTCVTHTQTYQCDAGKNTGVIEAIQEGETPFCLDGNCTNQSWDSNDEMGSAMAQLSILKQLQEDFRKDRVSLFKGDDNRCKKEALGFKDCCKDNGWGQSMNLASCSGDERLLAEKKSRKLCHFVGTYCDKKILGKCLSKKSTYCCFGTKLSRIFHEQGRAQISLGWGDAANPVCRGFSIDEIQKIDFSKIDLREVFEEVVRTYRAPDLSVMKKQIEGRMQDIQKSIKPNMNLKKLPSQRKEG